MKAVVLVNGVPASGKSTVARAISSAGDWPLLALDTIKEAFFDHLGVGDRLYNRTLGKASYQAMFDLVRDFPKRTIVVTDAWFGFQPTEVLRAHLARAGVQRVVEVWCHAPPEIVGERYRARLESRSTGHLGADYIPELMELTRRAQPVGNWPQLSVDTTVPLETEMLVGKIKAAIAG